MAGAYSDPKYHADVEPTKANPYSKQKFRADKRNWADIPFEAMTNVPSSGANAASGILNMVLHPIDTASTTMDAGAGFVRNALPDKFVNFVEGGNPNPKSLRASATADAIGSYAKDRYGNLEGFKAAIATDPVGVLSDVSMLFSGGALAAGKIPMLSRAAPALKTTAKYTNPIVLAGKTIGTGVPLLGRGVANVAGYLTQTGGMPLIEAARVGLRGGKDMKTFTDNMRGNVKMTDVLDDALANLSAMGKAKSDAYKLNMAKVSSDKSVLSFDEIDNALSEAYGKVTFKGQVKNARGVDVLQEMADEVTAWKKLDPAEFHTPEGLDALKQKLGAITEKIPFEERSAGMVAGNVRDAVKATIVKQAPVYAKTMQEYADAMDEISEIKRTLSLGEKSSVDTAMRKLQSLTRNNVNTNYSNRLDLAKRLEQQGRPLMPALAGQALNAGQPRGIGAALTPGYGMAGFAAGDGGLSGIASALAALAARSPRLTGEVALKLGQGAQLLKKPVDVANNIGLTPAQINLLSQAGLLENR